MNDQPANEPTKRFPGLRGDEAAFEKAIRDNLSAEAIATIIAFLQPTAFYKPHNDDAFKALCEVEWFTETLTKMLGVDEVCRLFEELCL